jgi:hypothetical protein
MPTRMSADVACVADIGLERLIALFASYALKFRELPRAATIPGSYWGESEAGLIGDTLYARSDTPIHSVLHEAAHFVCMDDARRDSLQRDAGGDHAEENAVCYLQILWADALEGFGCERMCRDMDAWGYTFRLGAAQRWFDEDAADAKAWLERSGVIDTSGRVTGKRRGQLIIDN